jgi:hypothetical protein
VRDYSTGTGVEGGAVSDLWTSVVTGAFTLVAAFGGGGLATWQARVNRNAQKDLATKQAEDARAERRYDLRLEAYRRFVTEIEQRQFQADVDNYEVDAGERAPHDPGDDPVGFAQFFRPVDGALSDILLVGSAPVRERARQLHDAAHNFFWNGKDAQELTNAIERFLDAARVELSFETAPNAAPKPREIGSGGQQD